MNFSELMKKTQTKLGLEVIEVAANKTLALNIHKTIVNISANEEYVFLISKLIDIPTEQKELIYDFLLKISNLGRLDAYVGLNNDEGTLTCTTKEYLETISEDYFIDCIGKHAQTTAFLCQSIEQLQEMPHGTDEAIDTKNMLKI